MVIAGNKCDKQFDKVIQFDDLEQTAGELECQLYFETSAMPEKRETIETLFGEIVRELNKKNQGQSSQPQNVKLR